MNEWMEPPRAVLNIGDDEANEALLRAVCALRPHLRLYLARDGAAATALGERVRPSLLIVQAQLADCGAAELLPLLRLRFGWGPVPAVVLANRSEPCRSSSFIDAWPAQPDARVVLPFLDRWLPQPQRRPLPPYGAHAVQPVLH